MFINNLALSLRSIVKSPLYAGVIIFTLSLGLGTNTALFSVLNAILLNPFPYQEPERLLFVYGTSPERNVPVIRLSFQEIEDLRSRASSTFSKVAAYDTESYSVAGSGEPRSVTGQRVTANFFDVLGVAPLLGRTFNLQEVRETGGRQVILNEKLWRNSYGANAALLGSSLSINGLPHSVIGVMPTKAEMADAAQLWVPVETDPLASSRENRFLTALCRLESGKSFEEAKSAVAALGKDLESQNPTANKDVALKVETLRNAWFGQASGVILVLLIMVLFVLLIACVNVANLMLARATNRRKEMALRVALGANRRNLIWQLLTESLTLAFISAVLGLLLGYWGGQLLSLYVPIPLPAWFAFSVDFRVVLYTFLISLVAVIVFGLWPAIRASRPDLNSFLKESGVKSTAGPKGNRLNRLLVSLEVALSLVLLVGGGLMAKSFFHLTEVDPGFKTQGVTFVMDMLETRYGEDRQKTAMVDQVLRKISSLESVKAVAAISGGLPLRAGHPTQSFSLPGQTPDEDGKQQPAILHAVSEEYFSAMGIDPLQGRIFSEADTADSLPVAVIDQELARRYWPEGVGEGHRLKFGGAEASNQWKEIIGVVPTVRYESLEDAPSPAIYVPLRQQPANRVSVVVASAAETQPLIREIRRAVGSVDSEQLLAEFLTPEELIHEYMWQWRLFSSMFWIAAGIALLLVAIGIYGVLAYDLANQVREIGIRMALGATKRNIVSLVGQRSGRIFMLGFGIGIPASWLLSKVLNSVLLGIAGSGLLVICIMSVGLMLVAASASFLPTVRATRVNPQSAIRAD